MRRLIITLVLALLPVTASAQSVTLTPQGHSDVRPIGNDSTYLRGLAIRRVAGELRFLSITHRGVLVEYTASGQTTGQWPLGAAIISADHAGLWYEQDRDRLWVTSSRDYTATYYPARVSIAAFSAAGPGEWKTFTLDVPAKRMFGGCQAVPATLVAQIGGPYVCGWGGYVSLIMQGGNASLGPTMYAIPDPDTIQNGAADVPTVTVLDAFGDRGIRKSWPLNYFDGGDPRPNGSGPGTNATRPTDPPTPTARYLSPREDGTGWWTWGDTYQQTGFWVGETFAAIPTLCGVQGQTSTTLGTTVLEGYSGACWYGESALRADGRMYELHTWNGRTLGSDRLHRPATMEILTLPRGGTHTSFGMVDAAYDAPTQTLYVAGFGMGPTPYDVRIYRFAVSADGSVPETPEEPSEPEQPEEPSEPTEPEEPAEPEQPTEPEEPAPSVTLDELAAALAEIRTMLVLPAPVECLITSTTSDTVTIRRSSCGLAPVERGERVRVLP